MKKVLMLLAMLALVLGLTVPALASPWWNNNNNGRYNNNNNNGWWNNNNNGWWNNNLPNGSGSALSQDPSETFISGSNTNNAGSVNSGGDNSNTCAIQQGFNNSGGILNQQEQQQYASQSGGPTFLGSTYNNTPVQSAPCEPTVQQAASSSSGY